MTKLKNKGYIYKVTNIITGQFYIGQRSSYKGTPEEDLGIHYFTSSEDIVKPLFMNNTSEWKKEILYRDIQYAETLDDIEGYAIHKVINDKLCLNGYDPSSHHGFYMTGRHHSDETRKKMREAAKHRAPISDETRANMSKAAKNRPPMSNEQKTKISEANKHHSPDMIAKFAKFQYGKHPSVKTRARMSEAQKHRLHSPMSDEQKTKLRKANLGKHPSEETKRKISAAVKKHWQK